VKQYEAVIRVMEENGGYATFAHLNQHVLRVPGCEWKTRTPFASIRRIVQENPVFFRIKPGLWALESYRGRLPAEMLPGVRETEEHRLFTHSYYQGLLVEVGNLRRFETLIPAQDRNRTFLANRRLGDLASLVRIRPFTYDAVVARAATIDVVWFNRRGFPAGLFEVEHSTDMKNSLLKFIELQDFRTDMTIVADAVRKRQFEHALEMTAFGELRGRVCFWSYEQLANLHTKTSELAVVEQSLDR